MNRIFAVVCMVILPMMASCGGGGGGGISTPTAAVITFSSQGTLDTGKAVRGFTAAIELPAGVSVKTAAGGVVDAAVVVPSGLLGGSDVTTGPVTYTPASTTSKAILNFSFLSTAAAGVAVGEYATITLILSGANPAVTDFTVTSFEPVDAGFAGLAGLSPELHLSVR